VTDDRAAGALRLDRFPLDKRGHIPVRADRPSGWGFHFRPGRSTLFKGITGTTWDATKNSAAAAQIDWMSAVRRYG
jgi:hypothetical protein